MSELENLTMKITQQRDTRLYRIMSGEFKLRNDGELDMRFKENQKIAEGDLK